ncbi:MAG: GNAT family N-acetyltransferase, partial [Desulfovibrio sp.]|nr:GNAT family N-acetyltransferase [Desulfovibrio sp.]
MDNFLLTEIDISERASLLPTITEIWETSVRASHDFLTDGDIARLKPLVEKAAASVMTLVIASTNRPVGFMGVEGRKIEMLFLHPDYFRRGIGTALVRFALERFDVDAVDCNEQNIGALAFYERMGFKVTERKAIDDFGNPFPILTMR